MANECLKAIHRRLREPAFPLLYFVGLGLDVGAGTDGFSHYTYLFPKCKGVRDWDLPDGDGQTLPGLAPDTFGFVHSSHSLEHMKDPEAALRRWLEVVKPGGHVIVMVPDEDLYEQGVFPSSWNPDHKHSFAIDAPQSWSHRSVNVMDLCRAVRAQAALVRLVRLEETFSPFGARRDQTQGIADCSIEFVLRKR